MAGKGLKMKEVDEIKRLRGLGLSNRQIAKALGLHRNTVNRYGEQQGEKEGASGGTFASSEVAEQSVTSAGMNWEQVRKDYLGGVTLKVIFEELQESGKTQLTYSGFWKQVKKNISLSEASMVRVFKPGVRTEIDYADGIDILDPVTGELRKTQLFVGVLCHSRYAFAEFTWSQKSEDFLESQVNMFKYFGGTTQLLSPDNLKSAVTKAHRYDPVINPAYTRFAEHYGVAVVPARVREPKDKAIVERTIQIFQRYFYRKVRNRTFTSLVELNKCLREHLVLFNNKEHRIFRRSRHAMYLEEKQHLGALPVVSYKVSTHHMALLSRDCHLQFDKSFYSAPHNLRGQRLDVWATSKVVEIYHEGERVALHGRRQRPGTFATDPAHYPAAQQAYAEEDIQKTINRAKCVGPETHKLILELLGEVAPLKNLRRAQGIISLSWKHSFKLLEKACTEGNRFKNYRLQYLERIIKTQQDASAGGVAQSETILERAFNPYLRGTGPLH